MSEEKERIKELLHKHLLEVGGQSSHSGLIGMVVSKMKKKEESKEESLSVSEELEE